jgi:hypothetical protein
LTRIGRRSTIAAMFRLAVAVVLCLGLAAPAAAQPDYFKRESDEEKVTFRVAKKRSTENKIVLGAMAGTAVLGGALGLIFHLRYSGKSGDVEASSSTGQTWSEELQDTYDSAITSRNVAVAGYAVGGAATIAAVVYFVLTDPGDELVEAKAFVAPTRDGWVAGKSWSF